MDLCCERPEGRTERVNTEDRLPLDWAATQNNLGLVLRTLGERESETRRLEEAVAAYREALKEYARERVPLQRAMTQSNLGTALATLATVSVTVSVTSFGDKGSVTTKFR